MADKKRRFRRESKINQGANAATLWESVDPDTRPVTEGHELELSAKGETMEPTKNPSGSDEAAVRDADPAGLRPWTERPTTDGATGKSSRPKSPRGPTWRGENTNWDEDDLSDMFAETTSFGAERLIGSGGSRGDTVGTIASPLSDFTSTGQLQGSRPGRSSESNGDGASQGTPEPKPVRRPPSVERPPSSTPLRPTQVQSSSPFGASPSRRSNETPLATGYRPGRGPSEVQRQATTSSPSVLGDASVAAPDGAERQLPGVNTGDLTHEHLAGRHGSQPPTDGNDRDIQTIEPPRSVARLLAERQAEQPAAAGSSPAPSGTARAGTAGDSSAHAGATPAAGGNDLDQDFGEAMSFLGDDKASSSLGQRVVVAVVLVALASLTFYLGPLATMVVVSAMTLLAVAEAFGAMRQAGLRPATLLGIVGAVSLPIAVFARGEAAYPLVIGLAVVFGMLWYLTGADVERPVLNLGLTLLGILWIGGLASFAALLVRADGGVGLLVAAVAVTVVADSFAYIGGRLYGRTPFHSASPNKTWEGTISGLFGALLVGLILGTTDVVGAFNQGFTNVMVFSIVVGGLAVIGDLAESLVKRDLAIKDMGSLLPGHGGMLDRIDAMLFALPGAYYVAVFYGII